MASKNKYKSRSIVILTVVTVISCAFPVLSLPIGIREGEDPSVRVRTAYEDTFELEDITEQVVIEEPGLIDEGNYTMSVLNGGTIQSTYFEGFEPTTYDEYSDITPYIVFQSYDESGLPVELLDAQFFAPDNTTYYIEARDSIIKEKPVMDSITIESIPVGEGVTRIGIGDTWSKIRTEDGVEGFVLTSSLSYDMVWQDIDRTVWVDTGSLLLRSDASTESEVVATLYRDDRLRAICVADKWYKVVTTSGQEGFVYISYTTTQAPPTPTPTPTPRRPSNSGGGGGGSSGGSGGGGGSSFTYVAPSISGANGQAVADIATAMLGAPYVWGASSSTAVDCSGLVCYCYAQLGVSLPHYSVSLMSVGTGVSRENIAPGDIVCWDTGGGYCGHVGIYVGGGQCIDARGSRWGVIYGSLDMHPILAIRRIFT